MMKELEKQISSSH